MELKLSTVSILTLSLLLSSEDNISKPKEFNFNQSTIQAFYFIKHATILGDQIDNDDWIGAFNNTTCVGSRKWNGPYTDIPAMGNDNSSYSIGYLKPNDIPSFWIYDKSEEEIYYAHPSNINQFGLGMAQIYHIDSLFVNFDCNGILGDQNKLNKYGKCIMNRIDSTKSNSQGQ